MALRVGLCSAQALSTLTCTSTGLEIVSKTGGSRMPAAVVGGDDTCGRLGSLYKRGMLPPSLSPRPLLIPRTPESREQRGAYSVTAKLAGERRFGRDWGSWWVTVPAVIPSIPCRPRRDVALSRPAGASSRAA